MIKSHYTFVNVCKSPDFFSVPLYRLVLFQTSNRTVSVANTLSGYITLAERLNYEEKTRYLVLVQANVSDIICKSTLYFDCMCVADISRCAQDVTQFHLHLFHVDMRPFLWTWFSEFLPLNSILSILEYSLSVVQVNFTVLLSFYPFIFASRATDACSA